MYHYYILVERRRNLGTYKVIDLETERLRDLLTERVDVRLRDLET